MILNYNSLIIDSISGKKFIEPQFKPSIIRSGKILEEDFKVKIMNLQTCSKRGSEEFENINIVYANAKEILNKVASARGYKECHIKGKLYTYYRYEFLKTAFLLWDMIVHQIVWIHNSKLVINSDLNLHANVIFNLSSFNIHNVLVAQQLFNYNYKYTHPVKNKTTEPILYIS